MAMICPACGVASRDGKFCDWCSTDLGSTRAPSSLGPAEVGDSITLAPGDRQELTRPEAWVRVQLGGESYRAHWIANGQWPAWEALVRQRQACRACCLPECRVLEAPTGRWILAEAAAPGLPLKWSTLGENDPIYELRRLATVLEWFGEALGALHAAGLVWLSFDPEAVETVDGRLRFTNLDLRVYPAGRCPHDLQIRPAFAAPEIVRLRHDEIGPRTDVFHLALFAYYWVARYLTHGFFGQGLGAFDFQMPPLRILAPWVPPGIAPVVHRGLEIEPDRRFASVGELGDAFRAALERAAQRWQATQALRWDVGLHSRTGLGKRAGGGVNEDCARVREWTLPPRALVLIADGVSSCEVGNGAVASRLVCDLVDGAIDAEFRESDFCRAIPTTCLEAGRALLQWALDRDERDRLLADACLMGTTLTAGWLEGQALTLANLGDSRAYLVDEAGAEQLTVDGDLGCTLLGAGAPPEDVRSLEKLARCLRDCVGGCYRTPRGELAVDEDRCRPRLSRWPLLPGDVIVLCTDGLVEEGAFLEPGDLSDLVGRYPDLPAAALAEKLALAAEERQRPPSENEPDGFGDNITCAVVRVYAAGPDGAEGSSPKGDRTPRMEKS